MRLGCTAAMNNGVAHELDERVARGRSDVARQRGATPPRHGLGAQRDVLEGVKEHEREVPARRALVLRDGVLELTLCETPAQRPAQHIDRCDGASERSVGSATP